MPWASVSRVPKKYQKTFRKKGYTAKQKRAWLKIFNSAMDQYKDEGKAFATAWSKADAIKESFDSKETFKNWLSRQTGEEDVNL